MALHTYRHARFWWVRSSAVFENSFNKINKNKTKYATTIWFPNFVFCSLSLSLPLVCLLVNESHAKLTTKNKTMCIQNEKCSIDENKTAEKFPSRPEMALNAHRDGERMRERVWQIRNKRSKRQIPSIPTTWFYAVSVSTSYFSEFVSSSSSSFVEK